MKRLLLAGSAVLGAWTLLDTVTHRLLLQPLYELSPNIWRPFAEMNPVLIGAVTPIYGNIRVLLIAVFLATYKVLVRPKTLAASLCLEGVMHFCLARNFSPKLQILT